LEDTAVKKKDLLPEYELPVFCQELHQLYRAGIPSSDSLELIAEDETNGRFKSIWEEMLGIMRAGAPLSSAMEAVRAFPVYMCKMIVLGEQTGRMEDVLDGLSRFYERKLRMEEALRSAVTVPAILLAVMLAVQILLITQVLPVFERVLSQIGIQMSGLAKAMVRLGSVLTRVENGIFIALAILVIAIAVIVLVPPVRQRLVHWFRWRFGGRGFLGAGARARFASSVSMAISSGMGMEEAVQLASQVSGGSAEIDAGIERCAALLRDGVRPSKAFAECGLFREKETKLLTVAAHSGSFPEALDTLAEQKEAESIRLLNRVIGTIEPVVVLITCALIGVILLSVMLPILGMLTGMG